MPTCFGHPQPSSGIKVHTLNTKWNCSKSTQFKTQVVCTGPLGFKLCTLTLEDSQG